MMRAYRFYIITIGLIILSFTMMTMTVNATTNRRLQRIDENYKQMEETYVRELREELTESGYRNAGITMTKVFYEDGAREYTVKLHHKRMERLDEQEREDLLEHLSQIEFTDSECRVYLKFL